jgi:hypothetical protein
MPPFWHLEFWDGSQIFKKYMHTCFNYKENHTQLNHYGNVNLILYSMGSRGIVQKIWTHFDWNFSSSSHSNPSSYFFKAPRLPPSHNTEEFKSHLPAHNLHADYVYRKYTKCGKTHFITEHTAFLSVQVLPLSFRFLNSEAKLQH